MTTYIDTRPSASFNGWLEQDEGLAGHLPGAVNLSHTWLDLLSNDALHHLLQRAGVEQTEPLRLYGDQADRVAERLVMSGFTHVTCTPTALTQFQSAGGRPVVLPGARRLVSATWLDRCIAGRQVPHAPTQPPLVIEVGWQSEADHLAGHIPGALYLETERFESAPSWSTVTGVVLRDVLLSLGITPTQPLVLYSRNTLAAARAAHLMLYAGVEDVRLLDGGLEAWTQAGRDLETGSVSPRPAALWPTHFPGRPELLARTPEVRRRRTNREDRLVAIRSWPEFVGETSGYPYIEARGRIPGARWGGGGSDAHHMEDFRNPDGTMRSGVEIAAQWRARGITPAHRVTLYCGTAWRASEAFFYALVMGWSDVAVYDGGWHAWSADRNNPIAVGAPRGTSSTASRSPRHAH